MFRIRLLAGLVLAIGLTVPSTVSAGFRAPLSKVSIHKPRPAPTVVKQTHFAWYAKHVYLRKTISKAAIKRLDWMRSHASSPKAWKNMRALQLHHSKLRHQRMKAAQVPAISSLAQCIINSESHGNPTIVNASGHKGIGQWDDKTWIAHGGGKYGPTAISASYAEQVTVLVQALRRYGCSAWCPYDPC